MLSGTNDEDGFDDVISLEFPTGGDVTTSVPSRLRRRSSKRVFNWSVDNKVMFTGVVVAVGVGVTLLWLSGRLATDRSQVYNPARWHYCGKLDIWWNWTEERLVIFSPLVKMLIIS